MDNRVKKTTSSTEPLDETKPHTGMNKTSRKVHFIGICGVGMSAVAKLLQDEGYEVSGSDEGFYPPISNYLEKINIKMSVGYKAENIPEGVDFVVIGKNAKLVKETNEEVREAYESGLEVLSFPEVLNRLTKNTHNIVCAGSHGKSTCSSLMSWCLVNAKKDPSFFIGAIPLDLGITSKKGESDVFVLEGDEYPSSNTDDSSKFLHYNAKDVLLTSVEHDHINVFKTQKDFAKPFEELLSSLPEYGLLVINNEDEQARKLLNASPARVITYSVDGSSHWKAENMSFGEESSFDLVHDGKTLVRLSTKMLGKHNIENIVGVSAMLLERNLLTVDELKEGVATFTGLERRLDKKTGVSSVPVYEGFGSSYKKAEAAIDAMKTHFPDNRLVVVFEPHTFSWRNKDYIHHYDTIFKDVDKVFVYKPAEQGSSTHAQLTGAEIVERVAGSGVDVAYTSNEEEGLTQIEETVMYGDVVLLLTSGNLDGMVQSIPNLLDEKFK